MVIPLSIGNPVSFFYQLNPQSARFPLPAVIANPNAEYALGITNGMLLLHSSQPLQAMTPCDQLMAPAADTQAKIRIFGSALSWQVLSELMHYLAAPSLIDYSHYQPHPDLPVAVQLNLPFTLSLQQQSQLSADAARWQVELVYLEHVPTLSKPGLLVMDMDSTAIEIECIDEIARLAGVGELVSAVTARAMNGELDFTQSLLARVAALKDAPVDVLAQVLAKLPLMPGVEALVQHLLAHNWKVAVASGGFTYFTDALKQQLNLSAAYANVLEIKEDKLTGNVVGPVVDANTKAQVVTDLAQQYGIATAQTVAIGDGANDIPMIKAASLGVAFHAKPTVQAQARAAIRHGSLLQLLYLLDK